MPASQLTSDPAPSASHKPPVQGEAGRAAAAGAGEAEKHPHALHHGVILGIASAVIVASFVLGINTSDRVTTPWLHLPLPPTCQFKMITSLDCPGCGLSRSFISIAHGQFVDAWQYNPACFVLFVFVLAQIPYRATQLWRIRHGQSELDWPLASRLALGIVVVTLVSQWLVRLAWTIIG